LFVTCQPIPQVGFRLAGLFEHELRHVNSRFLALTLVCSLCLLSIKSQLQPLRSHLTNNRYNGTDERNSTTYRCYDNFGRHDMPDG
jgi:hypothetical protein